MPRRKKCNTCGAWKSLSRFRMFARRCKKCESAIINNSIKRKKANHAWFYRLANTRYAKMITQYNSYR